MIASPLLRARQTSRPIAERAGLDMTVDQCLLDRDYGLWTGISRKSVTDRWGSVDRARVSSRSRRSATGPSGV